MTLGPSLMGSSAVVVDAMGLFDYYAFLFRAVTPRA
jgi:hypothetical protein